MLSTSKLIICVDQNIFSPKRDPDHPAINMCLLKSHEIRGAICISTAGIYVIAPTMIAINIYIFFFQGV